jgi:uncharacterized protein (TIGR02246 family)
MSSRLNDSERARDEAAIRALEAAYDAAWNADDIEALCVLLTPDVVVIDPFGGVTEGREEVRRFFRSLFQSGASGSTHTSRIGGIRFVADDVALVDAQATIEGLRLPWNEAGEPVVHSFTDVVVRDRDVWRISQVRAYVFMVRPSDTGA